MHCCGQHVLIKKEGGVITFYTWVTLALVSISLTDISSKTRSTIALIKTRSSGAGWVWNTFSVILTLTHDQRDCDVKCRDCSACICCFECKLRIWTAGGVPNQDIVTYNSLTWASFNKCNCDGHTFGVHDLNWQIQTFLIQSVVLCFGGKLWWKINYGSK